MSNPEKPKVDDVEEEKEDTDDQWTTDEESDVREIVLGLPSLRLHTLPSLRINALPSSQSNALPSSRSHALPALGINSERVGASSSVAEAEEEGCLNELAIVAAQLLMAAAEEAVMKEMSDGKKIKTAKKMKKLQDIPSFSGGSGNHGFVAPKKSKNRELTNPPEGPPACKICGKGFGSWKAVFGHMRLHKDRNYQGFLPPPTFSAVAETFSIPGPNSAFVRVTAAGGSSGVDGGGGSNSRGVGIRVFGFDLNVDPVEEEEQEVDEPEDVAMFDLNKSPPKDE